MSQKQVMPKSEDLSRSLEINAIWTFDIVVVVSLYFLQKYEDFQQNVYHIKIMKGTKIRVQRKTNKQ